MSRALEWLNRNSFRNYPFKEDTGLLSDTSVVLPLDFLVDFQCYAPFREGGRYRIGQMFVSPVEIKVYLLDDEDTFLGEAVIDVLNHLPGQDYPVVPLSSSHVSGLLVAGKGVFTVIETFFYGLHRFDLANGELEPSTVIPVTTAVVTSVGSSEDPLSGALISDVHLQGEPVGRGILIEVVDKGIICGGPPTGQCIQISAVYRTPPEDCAFLFNGRPLSGIEVLGVGTLGPSSRGGGVTIEARDIFYWKIENDKLVLDSLIDPKDLCIRPFDSSLRGGTGASGDKGPQGLHGDDVECVCVCPTCETCDTSEDLCMTCDACEVCDAQEASEPICDTCDTADFVPAAPILSVSQSDGMILLDSVRIYFESGA